MGGKVKEFQKIIQDDADFKDTVAGDHVSECPLSSRPRRDGTSRVRSCTRAQAVGWALRHRTGLQAHATRDQMDTHCACVQGMRAHTGARCPDSHTWVLAVVEAHQSWCGPCECVKPMLYRVSLDKEDIKFATAASDKVRISPSFRHPNRPPPWCLCLQPRHAVRPRVSYHHEPRRSRRLRTTRKK